jgi:hypothetical protein
MHKIIVGGLVGGITLYAWSFIAHLPPIGTAGERTLSVKQSDAVLGAMRSVMRERAVYVLPPFTEGIAKFEAGPAAVIAYNPRPAEHAVAGSPMATWFGTEMIADFAAAFLGAVIAAGLSSKLGYWRRVLILGAVGLLATIDIDVGYWNWYAFPTSYLAAQFVDHVGGWFVTGMVLARLCANSARSTAVPA